MSNGTGTSAHETGTVLSLDSNALRHYSPSTGKRRRKPSATSAMRAGLCDFILASCTGIRKVSIRDTGIYFHAHIYFHNGRILFRQSYSLQNLSVLLMEGIGQM